jgi:hypothetical protein
LSSGEELLDLKRLATNLCCFVRFQSLLFFEVMLKGEMDIVPAWLHAVAQKHLLPQQAL